MKKIAKAKSGKSFGMLSVKARIDKNPNPTAADRIAGAKMNAGKAKNVTKVGAKKMMAKKPMKKAQLGTTQYMELPEATVTASRIVDKPTKTSSSKKSKPSNSYRDIIRRSNKMNKNQSGFSRMNPRKMGFEEGGEVSMAKKGTSVKKKMMSSAKCKMGC
jgi:hypothetical protein